MMKIGGLINKKYSLNKLNKNFLYNGTYLINGRSALLLILLEIKEKYKINEILVPYFACPSIVNTIKLSKFKFNYYDVNIEKKNLIANDNKKKAILIIHYFGSKNHYTKFKNINFIRIEDFSHLFLNKKFLKKKSNNYVFASLRKHTHLRYGAWANKEFDIDEIDKKTKNFVIKKQKKLLSIKNKDKFQLKGEEFNQIIEKKYILKKLTPDLKNNFLKVNWRLIRNQRVKNFKYLKNRIIKLSKFKFLNQKKNDFPLNFFLIAKRRNHLKKFLLKKGVYTSIHWKIKKSKKFKFSSKLSNKILSLPIDQRYDYRHMQYIIENLKIYDKNY